MKKSGNRGADHAQHGPILAHLVFRLPKQVRPQTLSPMFRRDAQPAQTCHGKRSGPKSIVRCDVDVGDDLPPVSQQQPIARLVERVVERSLKLGGR